MPSIFLRSLVGAFSSAYAPSFSPALAGAALAGAASAMVVARGDDHSQAPLRALYSSLPRALTGVNMKIGAGEH